MEIYVTVPPNVDDVDALLFRLEKYFDVSAVHNDNRITLFGSAEKLLIAQNYALRFIGPESILSINVSRDCCALFEISGVTRNFELMYKVFITIKGPGAILVKGQKRDTDRFRLALVEFDKQCTGSHVSVTPFKLSNLRFLCRKFDVSFDEVPQNSAVQVALLFHLSSFLSPIQTKIEGFHSPSYLEAYRRPTTDHSSSDRVATRLCNESRVLSFGSTSNRSLSDDRENIRPADHLTPSSIRLRSVVIDGSNVAFAHGNQKKFSPKGIRLALEFFVKRGHTNVVAVVPRFRRSVGGPLFDHLERQGYLCYSSSRFMHDAHQVADDDRYLFCDISPHFLFILSICDYNA